MIELVIGGARSGKSRHAEGLALAAGGAERVVYVATGQAGDAEMAARIAHHQARRPDDWGLVEAPLHLAAALRRHASDDTCLLVDCLTLWLSNVLLAETPPPGDGSEDFTPGPLFDDQRNALLDTLPSLPGRILLVSNEVGWGIVPMGALARRFCDEQGRLNQELAALAQRVTLVAAGLPLRLKG